MYFDDHAPPHFHVVYAETEGAIRLDDVEVMPGSNLPRRAERLALEWARLRREELRAAWERAKHGQHPGKVAPLP